MPKKWISVLVLCVLAVIIILPMVLQNDIVKTIDSGSDMRVHTTIIREMNDGKSVETTYFGQIILAWMFKPVADSPHLDAIYLWFNFVVLLAVAFTLFYVVRKLVGYTSALLVVPIAFFVTLGVVSLFRYGVIFDLINMCLILPFALMFSVKWLVENKTWQLVLSGMLFALFSIVHYTGLYLPYAVGLALLVYIGYCLATAHLEHLKRVLLYGFGIFIMSAVLSNLFMNMKALGDGSIGQSGSLQILDSFVGYVFISIFSHLPFVSLLLLLTIVAFVLIKRKEIKMTAESKIFLLVLGCFLVSLGGGLLLRVTNNVLYINRIMVDASTIVAIGMASMVGLLLDMQKSRSTYALVSGFVAVGMIPVLVIWFKG